MLLKRLSLPVFEQISKMGRREIAWSYTDCLRNLLLAGGAGLITAATVVLKVLILHSPLSWALGYVLSAGNFILSFLCMQLLGFRLATKQSPLLGAALGRRWQEIRAHLPKPGILGGLVRKMWRNEISWTFLTQLFSAGGNLLFVIPAAYAFCFLYRTLAGVPYLDQRAAHAVLASLDPTRVSTIAYAAFTGVLLWFCTYLGGLIAHRYRPDSKTATTACFNITLGALLALVPLLGKALNLPLDVRHFTLSGGIAAVAAASLGIQYVTFAELIRVVAGVLIIGGLNFSISFGLAFLVSRLSAKGASALAAIPLRSRPIPVL